MNAPTRPTDLMQGRAIRCRAIDDADLPAVLSLLAEGFPRRSRTYWQRGLARLQARDVPADCPRYGFVIDVDGTIVGCLILIVSDQAEGGRNVRRANVSSWYVRPEYRFQASMLVSVAFRQRGMTFVNISPAPHTIPILKAQGYRQYVEGQVITVPALSRIRSGAKVTRLRRVDDRFDETMLPDLALLRRHADAGCLVLICSDGERYEPFVFVRRRIIRTIVPAAQLVWCRDIEAFPRYAGVLGRRLLLSGLLAVSCDANGPMTGMPNAWRPGNAPKFYRSGERPRLGDLADTELVYFGA